MLNRANELKIITQALPKSQLLKLVKQDHLQHLILKCSLLPIQKIELPDELNFSKNKPEIYLFLDKITDPQNLGAICRAAYFFVN